MKNDLFPSLGIEEKSSAPLCQKEQAISRIPLVYDDGIGGEMAQPGCRQNHLKVKRRKSLKEFGS
jgi:hypothetical protein